MIFVIYKIHKWENDSKNNSSDQPPFFLIIPSQPLASGALRKMPHIMFWHNVCRVNFLQQLISRIYGYEKHDSFMEKEISAVS